MLLVLYVAYAAVMGLSLSFIFLAYTRESIYTTLLGAAIMFGSMAFFGLVTQSDLTRMVNLLLMALMGIIISSLINLFLKSDSFSYVISLALFSFAA